MSLPFDCVGDDLCALPGAHRNGDNDEEPIAGILPRYCINLGSLATGPSMPILTQQLDEDEPEVIRYIAK